MNGSVVLLIPLILIALGAFLMWHTATKRKSLGVPGGKTVYQDTVEKPGQLLYSRRLGLTGRPDLLINQNGLVIPVEVKTGKTPRQPYLGHMMQLIAYCVLVEETYDVRPEYGLLRYQDEELKIEFSKERETALLQILTEMKQKQARGELHRSHTNPRVCAGCSFRTTCNERLDSHLLPLFEVQ